MNDLFGDADSTDAPFLTTSDLTLVNNPNTSATLTPSDLTLVNNPNPVTTTAPNYAQDVATGIGLSNGLVGLTGNILNTAANAGNKVAGTYNAQGQFVPLAASSGAVNTPGQTSIFGGSTGASLTSPLASIGTGISSALSGVSPYLPWLIIAGIALVGLKAIKKL